MNRLWMCGAALAVLSICVGLSPAAAQQQQQQSGSSGQGQSNSDAGNVRGQFYLPNGDLLQEAIRFQLLSEDGSRPPESIFTDSNGRFVLYHLKALSSYVILVDANAHLWGQTRETFIAPGGRNPTIQIQLAPVQRESGPARATVSAAQLRQKVPSAARKQFESALRLIEKGDREQAHPLLLRAIELFPTYVDARNELAVELMKAGKLDEAEQQLRLGLKVDTEAVLPNLNLGLCLQRQNRFADAQPFLEKAAQLAPGSFNGLLLLGYNLLRTGDIARGETLLIRSYELGGPRAAVAQYWLARLYTRRGDYARAAAALEIYLRDRTDAPDGAQLQQTLVKLRAAVQQP